MQDYLLLNLKEDEGQEELCLHKLWLRTVMHAPTAWRNS